MNKVIIENSYFNLDSPLSTGLITGLKRLMQKNFDIEVKDFTEDDCLKKVLYSEGIIINNKISEEKFYHTRFIISPKELKEDGYKIIVLSEKSELNTFEKAIEKIICLLRTSAINRTTAETDIKITLSLDGSGKAKIKTGIGFFDHMLSQIAKHANIDLDIKVKGDLDVDEHHTVEDVGIVLGAAMKEALGDKIGIKRYGCYLPMDESIAQCAIDLGGRSYLNFKCKFEREKVGEFPTELTEEFFRGLASGLKANIYLKVKGKNEHHKIEAMFKAFAKAFNEACRIDKRSEGTLPSTKGLL
jgi:imidazoleglycerol-phosphate dehydratase / histidinol-phosphatase